MRGGVHVTRCDISVVSSFISSLTWNWNNNKKQKQKQKRSNREKKTLINVIFVITISEWKSVIQAWKKETIPIVIATANARAAAQRC